MWNLFQACKLAVQGDLLGTVHERGRLEEQAHHCAHQRAAPPGHASETSQEGLSQVVAEAIVKDAAASTSERVFMWGFTEVCSGPNALTQSGWPWSCSAWVATAVLVFRFDLFVELYCRPGGCVGEGDPRAWCSEHFAVECLRPVEQGATHPGLVASGRWMLLGLAGPTGKVGKNLWEGISAGGC